MLSKLYDSFCINGFFTNELKFEVFDVLFEFLVVFPATTPCFLLLHLSASIKPPPVDKILAFSYTGFFQNFVFGVVDL